MPPNPIRSSKQNMQNPKAAYEFRPRYLLSSESTTTKSIPTSQQRQSTFERLSVPKLKEKQWLPDRPSVYWLDYIIDPTPHEIKDSVELSNYYEKFKPKFPRMSQLATPRKYPDVNEDDTSKLSRTSLRTDYGSSPKNSVSLPYVVSERIKELAKPKHSRERLFPKSRLLPPNRPFTKTGIRSASQEVAQDKCAELAQGDFVSRSQHGINAVINKDTFPFSAKYNRPTLTFQKMPSKDKISTAPRLQEERQHSSFRRPAFKYFT